MALRIGFIGQYLPFMIPTGSWNSGGSSILVGMAGWLIPLAAGVTSSCVGNAAMVWFFDSFAASGGSIIGMGLPT